MALANFESARSFGLAPRLRYLVKSVRARAEEHRAYRTTLAELNAMTDRELADFGFHRSELPRVAREAVALR